MVSAAHYLATPEYRRLLGLELIEGRFIEAHDRADSQPVAVIDERMAQHVFGGKALGKRLTHASRSQPWAEIVGVVRHATEATSDGLRDLDRQVYMPFAQSEATLGTGISATFLLETSRAAETIAPEIRAALGTIDPHLTLWEIVSLSDRLQQRTFLRRWLAAGLSALAVLALILSAVGLYGTLAQRIAERMREIAVRVAVGAPPGHAARLVYSMAGRVVAVGVFFGALGVAASSRLLARLLFGVTPFEPGLFVVNTVMMVALAFSAILPLARRATNVEPMTLLRHE